MQRAPRRVLFALLALLRFFPFCACGNAQAAAPATATLREVHSEGMKNISESQITVLSNLEIGAPVARADLQAAADRLVQTGLFAKVSYNFQTRQDGVVLTFHVEESPRLPAYFDNIPWFSDGELGDAIRKKLPFFDGTLPAAGTVVEQAADAVSELLRTHGLRIAIEHQVQPNPLGDGSVQSFQVHGATLQIAGLEFSDPALASLPVVRAHLSEIIGKPYSRLTIELFLAEQIRPVYLQKGYLRAKLGPPEVRLTGDPNQKLPERLPVFIPVVTGPAYKWDAARWHGNSALSEITLNNLLGEKSGAVANGQEMEAGWDRIREQYGVKGYLEVKIDAMPSYDYAAQTISYAVSIEEGPAYHFGKLVLSGLSLEGERRLKQAWPLTEGALFDKSVFEEFLTKLETHPPKVFGELPVHYDGVGHWLQTDPKQSTVDVLLDFKQ